MANNMTLPQAFAICKNIKDCQRPDDDKGLAIYMMLKAETINSITKADLKNIVEYLHELCFDIEEG